MSVRRFLAAIAVMICVGSVPAFGQASRFTINFGVGVGFNQGALAKLADTSGSIVVGVGYSLSDTIVADAEYQYYNVDVKDQFDNPFNPDAAIGQVDSVSANILLKVPNKLRLYGIGGVGWYRRFLRVEAPTVMPAFVADPAIGFNIGTGVAFPFGTRLKLYGEVRYHHAYNRGAPTEVLPITIGFRW